jgi:hypothetical protein
MTYLNDSQASAIKSEHKFLVFRDIFTCFEGKTGSTIVKKVCKSDTGKIVVFQEAIRLLARLEERPLPITILYHHRVEASIRGCAGRINASIESGIDRGRKWCNIFQLW